MTCDPRETGLEFLMAIESRAKAFRAYDEALYEEWDRLATKVTHLLDTVDVLERIAAKDAAKAAQVSS